MNVGELKNIFGTLSSKLRGQFSPEQLSSRLFMERDDIANADNILVWFHERFHYLQIVFTPYGQLKWSAYRTVVTDVLEAWLNLSSQNAVKKKVPLSEYLKDGTNASLQIAANTWMHSAVYEIYSLVEHGVGKNLKQFIPALQSGDVLPRVQLQGKEYFLRGIDILESFAKFEEAMLGELVTGKTLDEFIDPEKLNPEYYAALYYFIEEVGVERLAEFPIICELALTPAHIPAPFSIESYYENAPNWRFVNLVNAIKDSSVLPAIDFYSDDSFYEYADIVLKRCNYPTIDQAWQGCIDYANSSDLTMAEEMKAAIDYKRAHPWSLSYPMRDYDEFTSDAFSRFEPYFTIVDDGVLYNTEHINREELLLENHLQALVKQICGQMSPYCIYTDLLMCGYSYMGNKTCPHYISEECTGHIDPESDLINYKLDEEGNLTHGCSFEMALNVIGTSIRDIHVGDISKSLSFKQLSEAAKKIKTLS